MSTPQGSSDPTAWPSHDDAATENGTASASPNKPAPNDHVELRDMPGAEATVSDEDDLMQLARLGDVGRIQKLFDEGKFTPAYRDAEGITPLHWAAINNQYGLCRYLIEMGAEVNAKGGESVATPAMWAAQKCHYYIVNLLLQHGADPLLTDVQGYNLLHLATFDGSLFLLVLLLHQNISVDVADPQGHTCLMWAAFKGYPACVDLFLRWGANVYAIDENGFTALHWALVKGSYGCIQKLIEYGSDRSAKTSAGKTPAVIAEEMRSSGMWLRALAQCGYNEDGSSQSYPGASYLRGKGILVKFFFLWPFLLIWCVFMILSYMVIYAAIPLAAVAGYGLQWIAQQALLLAPPDMKDMHRTPFLAGVFAGTCFWVGVRWFTTILPGTFSTHPVANLLFGVCYGLCTYYYCCSMLYDPGYVPKLAGLTQQKAVIDELLSLRKFDDENFCIPCMVRRPVRSKHCKKCARCVAKHDHHCPWIYNCVGVNNHRHFFFYIIFMELGVIVLVNLTLGYLAALPTSGPSQCNIISDSLCAVLTKDPYTIVLTTFTCLQLTWVTMLIVVQLVQIARAQTTFENMRGNVHRSPPGGSEAITSALLAGTTSLEGAELTSAGMGPDPALPVDGPGDGPHRARREGFFSQWKRLLGLDTFAATAHAGLFNRRTPRTRRDRNPFSRGLVTNCADFWCDGSPVLGRRETGSARLGGRHVNYTKLYDVPPPVRPSPLTMRAQAGGGDYQRVDGDDDSV